MKKYLYIVSQKKSLEGDFIQHIKSLVEASAQSSLQSPLAGLILREKEISAQEYSALVEEIAPLCKKNNVPLFLNADINLTLNLAQKHSCHIHTTFANYKQLLAEKRQLKSIKLGVSIHSTDEAHFILDENRQEILPLHHVLVGHIFETDCKKNLASRGLDFLKQMHELFSSLPIKLIAIGGINQERAEIIQEKNYSAVAIMSLAMKKQMSMSEAKSFLNTFSFH